MLSPEELDRISGSVERRYDESAVPTKPPHLVEKLSHRVCAARELNFWGREQLINPETHAAFESNFVGKSGWRDGWTEDRVSVDPRAAFTQLIEELGVIWYPVLWVPDKWKHLTEA